MDIKPILEELARLAGKDAGSFTALLEEGDEGTKLKDTWKQTIGDAFGDKFKTVKDEQYSRGKRETMEEVERYVKGKYSAGKDLRGTELLDAWEESLKQPAEDGKATNKVTPDLLEKDEVAQSWLNAKVDKLKADLEEAQNRLQETQSTYERERLQDRAKTAALQYVEAKKVALSKDEDLRKRQLDALLRLIDHDKLKMSDDGNLVVVDENGYQVKDAHHNPVGFNDYLDQINPYGYHQFDPDKDSPSTPKGQPNGQPAALVIRSKDQYDKLKQEAERLPRPKQNARKAELQRAYAEFLREGEQG